MTIDEAMRVLNSRPLVLGDPIAIEAKEFVERMNAALDAVMEIVGKETSKDLVCAIRAGIKNRWNATAKFDQRIS